MTTIYRYQPVSDAYTTYHLRQPLRDGQLLGQRIAELDGYVYWALPADAELPPQPEQIALETVTMSDELKAQLRAASPQVRRINEQVREAIAQRYQAHDEIKMLRQGSGAEFDAYNAYVEECRAWGSAQKAEIGL